MGIKLLWTGLAFILALNPFLELIGLHGSPVLVQVGAAIMIIGLVAFWLNQ